VKYLLNQPCVAFRKVGVAQIDAAGTVGWQETELLSGTAGNRSGARIMRRGEVCPDWFASSSHCGVYTACIVARGRVGLDLESVEARRREFYSGMFSAEEQDWAWRFGGAGISSHAGFTWLWTVKEAFLKASGRADLSVWNFPRWTVRFHDRIEDKLGRCRPFCSGSASIFRRGFSQSVRVEAQYADNMILTAVRCSDAAGGSTVEENNQ